VSGLCLSDAVRGQSRFTSSPRGDTFIDAVDQATCGIMASPTLKVDQKAAFAYLKFVVPAPGP